MFCPHTTNSLIRSLPQVIVWFVSTLCQRCEAWFTGVFIATLLWCVSHGLVHNTPYYWCCKSSFLWCGFVLATRSAQNRPQHNYVFLLWHFWNSLTHICPRLLPSRYFHHSTWFLRRYWDVHGDTAYLSDVLAYRKIYMCACIWVFCLLFQDNLCTSAWTWWRYVMFTKTCLLRACDIHIDVCYLL